MGDMAELYDQNSELYEAFAECDSRVPEAHRAPIPGRCRYCNGPVFFVDNKEVYGRSQGKWPMIYCCVRKECGARVGAHPNTRIPLGTLAPAELRVQRMAAKNSFHAMLRAKNWGRSEGYRWLSEAMPCPPEKCHFGMFEIEQCERVAELCDVFRGGRDRGGVARPVKRDPHRMMYGSEEGVFPLDFKNRAKTMNSTVRPVVIYHASCLDGWLSAYAAYTIYGDQADYVPALYGDKPPPCENRRVFILDFSYPKATLLQIAKQATQVTILDHHKTARDDLESILGVHPKIDGQFDMEQSGAALSWWYFHPSSKALPWAIKIAEDRDLWRFKYTTTKSLAAYMQSFPFEDFAAWDKIVSRLRAIEGRTAAMREGDALLRQHNQLCSGIIESAGVIDRCIGGYVVPTVNAPPQFASEIGHRLSEKAPWAAVWWQSPRGYHYSLRSRKGGVDVSRIAQIHGGGGHANAAGFTVKANPDPYRKDSSL